MATCCLNSEHTVIIQPYITPVTLCLTDHKSGISEVVSGSWVLHYNCGICQKTIEPRGEWGDTRSLDLATPGRQDAAEVPGTTSSCWSRATLSVKNSRMSTNCAEWALSASLCGNSSDDGERIMPIGGVGGHVKFPPTTRHDVIPGMIYGIQGFSGPLSIFNSYFTHAHKEYWQRTWKSPAVVWHHAHAQSPKVYREWTSMKAMKRVRQVNTQKKLSLSLKKKNQ